MGIARVEEGSTLFKWQLRVSHADVSDRGAETLCVRVGVRVADCVDRVGQ